MFLGTIRSTVHGMLQSCVEHCVPGHATYADLLHVVQEVHDKVGTEYVNHSGYRQAPEAVTQLWKDLYFF